MTTLHIQNIHPSVKQSQITAAFSKCGRVTRIFIMRGRCKPALAGIAFVEMEKEIDARIAVAAYHGRRLGGQPLSVRLAD